MNGLMADYPCGLLVISYCIRISGLVGAVHRLGFSFHSLLFMLNQSKVPE